MKVLHSYCLNHNIGDYALGYGLKSLLRKYLKVSLIAETNLQGQYFNEYYIHEVINKKYDLLVIGGGGIIHGKHWPNGWFWLIDIELIKEIKIPFLIYGVGNNYWENEGGIPERTKLHLTEVNKFASYFSVRNDGSYERLYTQTDIKANVVPDPGFHVNLYEDFKPLIKEEYVVIQLANDKPEMRFEGNNSNLDSFILTMRETTKKISKKYKVIFIPHVYEDIELSNKIANGITNTLVLNFGNYAFDKSNVLISYYKFAKFVIAMRGHGQIIPISFNTPVISISNHPKHIGLMRNLGLELFNINIDDLNFIEKMDSLINLVELNYDNIKNNLININERLEFETKTSFDNIIQKLN